MNNFQKILCLFCALALVAISNAGNPDAFSIVSSELITVDPEFNDDQGTRESVSTEAPAIEPVDFSDAVLTISYETTNSNGEVQTETLYEGPYDEHFVHLLQVDDQPFLFSEPTEVTISLKNNADSEPRTINTVIDTGSDVRLVYVDHPGPRDEFLVFGSSNQVLNPENKFSITGNLSFLENDSPHTTSVFAWAVFVNSEGERQSKQWGPVLVEDGSFLIEGDVDRPITATLYVRNQSSFYNGTARIILEPQGELKVAKLGNQTQELSLVSGSGYHAQLIESWQQSDEYVAMVEAWTAEQERSRNAPNEPSESADEAEDETTSDSEEEVANNEDDSETDAEDTSEVDSVELVDAVVPAEGCEDAVAQEEEAEPVAQTSAPTYPKWYTLRMEATAFQNEKLQDIAKNHKDPNAQLLAMQMGVFSPYDNAEEAIAVWQSLSEKFDADFVATYITPELERIELVHTRTLNNEALVPGQKVPAFTLANLEGDDVSLYDLAGTKDMVLIDFWASWCGPCIATFPELKKLHAAYTDENFEIVGVSVDDNLEDWSGGVEDHQLPWVQLGELKDADNGSPVSVSYGINFIPSTFLIDSQGCIYRKNIHPGELKTFLVDRYGLDESLVEPEEEREETPEISS